MTMTGIWTQNDEGWKLSPPQGFADEATLHDLIEQTPEILPLSGTPTLLILGREVPLGSGYADLVGVETSGRPVIIEVKLAPEQRGPPRCRCADSGLRSESPRHDSATA